MKCIALILGASEIVFQYIFTLQCALMFVIKKINPKYERGNFECQLSECIILFYTLSYCILHSAVYSSVCSAMCNASRQYSVKCNIQCIEQCSAFANYKSALACKLFSDAQST